jgi:CspA family cold shock protein
VTDTTTKHTGVVSWFGGNGRRYGFIAPDDGGKGIFVHISAAGAAGLRDLKEGDRLQYSIEVDERSGKQHATNLRIVR